MTQRSTAGRGSVETWLMGRNLKSDRPVKDSATKVTKSLTIPALPVERRMFFRKPPVEETLLSCVIRRGRG